MTVMVPEIDWPGLGGAPDEVQKAAGPAPYDSRPQLGTELSIGSLHRRLSAARWLAGLHEHELHAEESRATSRLAIVTWPRSP